MPVPTDPANVRGPMPAKPDQNSPMGMRNAPGQSYAPMAWGSSPFYAVRPQQFSWGMQPHRMLSASSPLPTPIPGNSPHGNIRQDDVNQAWQALYGNPAFGGPPVSVNPYSGPSITVTGGSPGPLSTWGGLPFGSGYTPAGTFPSGPGGQPMNWYNGPAYVGGGNPGFGSNNFGGGFDPFGTGGSFKLPEQKPDYQG